MSLRAELKRRNVFKVGAAYLVVAWLVRGRCACSSYFITEMRSRTSVVR